MSQPDAVVERTAEASPPEQVEPPRRSLRAIAFVIVLLVLCGGFLAFYLLGYLPSRNELDAVRAELSTRLAERDHLRHRVTELERGQQREQARIAEIERSEAALRDTRDRLVAERDAFRASQQQTAAALAALEQAQSSLRERLAAELSSGDASVSGEGGRLSVALGERVLFPLGEADLNERGRAVLGQVVASLASLGDRIIRVEGHTDATPIRDDPRYPTNWELSTARASTVVRFLEQQGVSGSRLIAAGYGPFHPLASNRTAEGRRRNRRIELILEAR